MPNVNEEFLDLTGLSYFKGRLDNTFPSKTEFDTLEAKVEEIISEGGEPNVIEVVKVNNTPLTPDANKAVNVEVPKDLSDLTNTGADPFAKESDIPSKVSELTNDGDGTTGSKYATEKYVDDNGGKIDKIKVNDVEQTITNKTVNITVPEDLEDLTNTGSDPFIQQSDLDAAIVGALKPKGSVAFASLPALTAANLNNVYNVTDAFTTTADFVEGAGKSYPAGTEVAIINNGTDASPVYKYSVYSGFIDLSNYWDQTNLTAITTAFSDCSDLIGKHICQFTRGNFNLFR